MHRRRSPASSVVVAVVVVTILLAACSGGSGGSAAPRSTSTTAKNGSTTSPSSSPSTSVVPPVIPSGCDPIVGSRCGLPFPNDAFSVADAATDTGRRVALVRASMPANKGGVRIDVTEQNRNDGFSPGSALLVQIPGIDLKQTGAAPITDIAASLADDAPIVLVDATTGERHPYWAELDTGAKTDDDRLLLVRPARDFVEGHRYVVGLRNLKDTTGRPIAAPRGFRLLRDRPNSGSAPLEARRADIEQTFGDLDRAGVIRKSLTLAWDLTIASQRSLSERILHMRDDAFASLGDAAPAFTVTKSVEATGGTLLRTVTGTFQVPRYLTGTGAPGSVLTNGSGSDDPRPKQNGRQTANFVCTVPRSAVDSSGRARPTRMSLFGHGLLGEASQVEGVGPEYAKNSNTTFCATDWIGLASADVANAVATLQDLSNFRSMADRMQQGMLNFLFLGRLMKSPKGLTTDAAFQDAKGGALLDHQHLVMVGLSQGGIMGGATTAVAQDWDRALLGVPGANYSLLLNRSVDFDQYGTILIPAYPSAADRQLGLQLIQMLWDRGENNGYAQHFTKDPYPGTKAKQFLLFEAFGDHQVANISTEVLARTMGARVRTPALDGGRSPDKAPLFDLHPVGALPASAGSYLVLWDFGTPAPPLTNTPNRAGQDPHGMGRGQPEVLAMGARFLESGQLIDVCDGQPCASVAGP